VTGTATDFGTAWHCNGCASESDAGGVTGDKSEVRQDLQAYDLVAVRLFVVDESRGDPFGT